MVLADYGALIPTELLEQAEWLNVHPSLLPRWRGAAPVERAIMAGDRETGVSIIRLVEELDAGPIGAVASFPIELEDDAGAVYGRAADLAPDLLERALWQPSSARRTARSRMPRRSARRTACSTGRGRRKSCTTGSGRSRRTSARAESSTAVR